MLRTRFQRAAIVAALVAGLGAPAMAEGEAPSGDAGLVTVAGDATASGVRFSYEVPAEFLAVTHPVDGGGPVAQAHLGSGLARSAAALPFPGDLVIAGPGLFYLATGITLPGSYPFYVSAEHPGSPESALADPSGQYHLSAQADGRSAAGLAQALFGPPEGASGGTRTEASIETRPDGSAVARAESVAEALSLGGGVLRIAAVQSTSVTTLAADATTAVTERALVVEGATVAGQPVTIDAQGVHAEGGTVPVPFAAGAEQVSAALAGAGISARVLSEDDGQGGAVEVLEIQDRHPLPFAGNPEGTFTWRIGRTTTSLVRTGILPVSEPPIGSAEPAGEASGATAPAPGPVPATTAPAEAVEGAAAPGSVPLRSPGTAGPGAFPPGYDPGPVAAIFETGPAPDSTAPAAVAGPGEPAGTAGRTTAAALAVTASAQQPGTLDRVRALYGAVALGAVLMAGLAGLWWRKGVSWRAS